MLAMLAFVLGFHLTADRAEHSGVRVLAAALLPGIAATLLLDLLARRAGRDDRWAGCVLPADASEHAPHRAARGDPVLRDRTALRLGCHAAGERASRRAPRPSSRATTWQSSSARAWSARGCYARSCCSPIARSRRCPRADPPPSHRARRGGRGGRSARRGGRTRARGVGFAHREYEQIRPRHARTAPRAYPRTAVGSEQRRAAAAVENRAADLRNGQVSRYRRRYLPALLHALSHGALLRRRHPFALFAEPRRARRWSASC